jgi:antitoxin VapB
MRVKAKVFTTGRSQAVRLPAAFRFDTKEVYVERDPRTGDVILSRRPAKWGEIFAALDEAGATEFVLDRDTTPPQERSDLW